MANAGFFSDLLNSVVGNNTQVSEVKADTEVVHNSQTIPLLESSINPDTKNVKDIKNSPIVEDEALSPETQGTDSEINSYISSSEKITTYIVKKGDTLGSIAIKFNISKNTILYANTNIKNNVLIVGQTLIILPVDGVSYTVKKGDNISLIAKAFKADSADIMEYNDISDKNLKIGDKIIVPGGTAIKKTEVVIAPKAEKEIVKQIEQPKVQITVSDKNTEKEENKDVTQSISSGKGILNDYIWPFPTGVGRVSQKLHDDNAYDFAAPKGTPIYAINDGAILIADGSGYNGGYGLYVVIDFNDGGQAIFGHMSKVVSHVGDVVKKGDIIGYVGSTGRSTGNHVHIGYRGGKSNPYKNLSLNSSL